jgi:hypothetical protein
MDRDEAILIVTDCPNDLDGIPEEFRADRAVVLAAVTADSHGAGESLRAASEELRDDRELVLAAITNDSYCEHDDDGTGCSALEWASERLRADKDVVQDVVLAAVELNGAALQYASDALRGDREVVEMACEEDGWQEGDGHAVSFASDAFKADKVCMLLAGAPGQVWCRLFWRCIQGASSGQRSDAGRAWR